jgi:hypothetical protein
VQQLLVQQQPEQLVRPMTLKEKYPGPWDEFGHAPPFWIPELDGPKRFPELQGPYLPVEESQALVERVPEVVQRNSEQQVMHRLPDWEGFAGTALWGLGLPSLQQAPQMVEQPDLEPTQVQQFPEMPPLQLRDDQVVEQVVEEGNVDMARENFANLDEWIEHRFAPAQALQEGIKAPPNFKWRHEEKRVPIDGSLGVSGSVVQPTEDGGVRGSSDEDDQDALSSIIEEPVRWRKRRRATEHEVTNPVTPLRDTPLRIGGKSLFPDVQDCGQSSEEEGEVPEGGVDEDLPEMDDAEDDNDCDETTLPYGDGSVKEIEVRDMVATSIWGAYYGPPGGLSDGEGGVKVIDPTIPATVVKAFKEPGTFPATRDTVVSIMSGDMLIDPADVVILDLSSDLNMKGWDVRTRFLYSHPGLEDLIWKRRARLGTFFWVRGSITFGRLLFVFMSRKRWVPQVGTQEVNMFEKYVEIFKEIRTLCGEKEIAMTLPSVPSLSGRRFQIARCVASACRGTGMHVRLYQSF